MKSRLSRTTLFCATVAWTAPLAAAAQTASLDVEVRAVRSAQGNLRADLYAPGRRHVAKQIVPAVKGALRLRFQGLAPGDYAVLLYHDEDADGRLGRRGPLGLPSEGYAFSRDAPARMGPPSFEAMRVRVPAEGTSVTTATVRYP